MTNEQLAVHAFHQTFGLTINRAPTLPGRADVILRRELISEELDEFCCATSLTEVADALGDLLYVVYGAAVTYGIDLEPIFNEIHRSNMSKVWPDGSVKKNELGKVLKPETYSPANLAAEIERQLAL